MGERAVGGMVGGGFGVWRGGRVAEGARLESV